MSEEGRERPESAAAGPWRRLALWSGCIIGLGVFGVVLLYLYGDPRPATVNAADVGGGPARVPTAAVGENYYRIRAEYIPLPSAVETADPVGRAWAVLFAGPVRRAGAAKVEVLVSYPGDTGPQVLLDTPSEGPAKSAVTGFGLRRAGEPPRLRVDVEQRGQSGGGLLPTLQIALNGEQSETTGWIAAFPGGSPTADGGLDQSTALQTVRDFKGRAVGAVRFGVETRRSLIFGDEFVTAGPDNAALKRLLEENGSGEARRLALLGLLEANMPPGFGGETYKQGLTTEINRVFAPVATSAAATDCGATFERLRSEFGLTSTDAALISFIGGFPDAGGAPPCAGGEAGSTLTSLGAPAAARAILADRKAEKERAAAAKQEKASAKQEKASASDRSRRVPSEDFICSGVSGERVRMLCQVLNEIAGEWRSGVKLLNMEASRRHIREDAGLQEPTLDMGYGNIRIKDRRDLLIHIALLDVENFACFQMVHQNPAYFEALVVLRDGSGAGPRRVDVFEFVFDQAGKIARIRRRAAVSRDIDDTKSLPESLRCRQDFIGRKEAALRRIIREQWRLPASSG